MRLSRTASSFAKPDKASVSKDVEVSAKKVRQNNKSASAAERYT
jgi:hypothetical protein